MFFLCILRHELIHATLKFYEDCPEAKPGIEFCGFTGFYPGNIKRINKLILHFILDLVLYLCQKNIVYALNKCNNLRVALTGAKIYSSLYLYIFMYN